MPHLSRRLFVLGMPAVFAGCTTTATKPTVAVLPPPPPPPAVPEQPSADMYAEVTGEPFPIPAAPLKRIRPAFMRRTVVYQTAEKPGTVVIDPSQRYLYFVEEDGRAIRYGVGVGREGFGWNGVADVRYKQEWPKWFPPPEMIARQPELQPYTDGMPGGPGNPLGCRAMYLWQGNKDTLFRIHGTVEPWTIGSRVSSGCIRMINQDVLDLYARVPLGTKVVVLPG